MPNYIVLRATNENTAWMHVGDIECRTPEKACEEVALDTNCSGEYIAIPARHWTPDRYEIVTKRHIERGQIAT